MSEARVAGGLDRLPWLADEPKSSVRIGKKLDLTGWAAAAALLIAAIFFWLGAHQTIETAPQPVRRPATRVALPVPRPAAPLPQVRISRLPDVAPTPVPEVRPAPAPQFRIAPLPIKKVVAADVARQAASNAPTTSRAIETRAPTAPKAASQPALVPWPPRVTAGAGGRLVQIGAYGSRIQAKHGWVAMVRAYPAVAHLPALVVENHNSKGVLFYRFQIGTTSQAHSEVLCQRMQKIDLSCAVVGLPWKAKVER